MISLRQTWRSLRALVAPLHDGRALLFIVLCLGGTAAYDAAMAQTVAQFMLPAGAYAAFLVIICRYVFPQIDLKRAVEEALAGNTAGGLMVLAIALYMGLGFLALALWMRA